MKKGDEHAVRKPSDNGRKLFWTLVMICAGILATLLYFRYEHDASMFIRSLGPLGVIAAILLMALLCIVPFPAEFLMVVDMQIFGVWLGILYVWIGAMLGSYATFWMARRFGEKLIGRFVKPEHLQRLNREAALGGPFGLLMARLIPFIPFVVFNYACGLLPELSLVTYLWTTGLGIVPYDLGAALIFLGFSSRIFIWIVIGGVAFALIWLLIFWLRRRHFTAAAYDLQSQENSGVSLPMRRRKRSQL